MNSDDNVITKFNHGRFRSAIFRVVGGKSDYSVRAPDDFRTGVVIVTIINAPGFEVESNMAAEMPTGEWVYKATELNPFRQGDRVVVRVTDSPGNAVKTFRMLEGT